MNNGILSLGIILIVFGAICIVGDFLVLNRIYDYVSYFKKKHDIDVLKEIKYFKDKSRVENNYDYFEYNEFYDKSIVFHADKYTEKAAREILKEKNELISTVIGNFLFDYDKIPMQKGYCKYYQGYRGMPATEARYGNYALCDKKEEYAFPVLIFKWQYKAVEE